MSKTRIVNVNSDEWASAVLVDRNAVYIGRANGRRGFAKSFWSNPFHLGYDGTRVEVIEKYRAYLMDQPNLLARLPELRGKVLGCFCAPLACHGDCLVELVEALEVSE